MELKMLKPRLGNWLTIEELRDFFATVPDEVGQTLPINRKLLEVASRFVEERQGWWEHHDWESFLERLHNEGFNLSEEAKPRIGNILEIFKSYYHRSDFQTVVDKRRKSAAERAPNCTKTATRKTRGLKEA